MGLGFPFHLKGQKELCVVTFFLCLIECTTSTCLVWQGHFFMVNLQLTVRLSLSTCIKLPCPRQLKEGGVYLRLQFQGDESHGRDMAAGTVTEAGS